MSTVQGRTKYLSPMPPQYRQFWAQMEWRKVLVRLIRISSILRAK